MKSLFLPIALALTLLQGVAAQDDKPYEFIVQQGQDAVFNCSFLKEDGCRFAAPPPAITLLVDDYVVAPAHLSADYNDRVGVKDQETCVVTVSRVKISDAGVYTCNLVKFKRVRFNLTVIVLPKEPELFQGHIPIVDGGSIVVDPNPDTKSAQFKCTANDGFPKPVFSWLIDSNLVTDIPPPVYVEADNKVFTKAESTIDVKFDDQEYDTTGALDLRRKIECVVDHVGYEGGQKRVMAIAGRSLPVKTVTLKPSDSSDIIHPDQIKIVTCVDDGHPPADDFIIEKKGDDEEWEKLTQGQSNTWNITKSGVYRCQARNHHNGVALSDYIISGETKFIDPGLGALTAQTDSVATVVAIVVSTLVVIAVMIAVVTYLYRNEKACFKRGGAGNPHSGTDGNVENGKTYENEAVNTEKKGDNPKDGVNPAPNHQ